MKRRQVVLGSAAVGAALAGPLCRCGAGPRTRAAIPVAAEEPAAAST